MRSKRSSLLWRREDLRLDILFSLTGGDFNPYLRSFEEFKLRFAVHRPDHRQASPRGHRVPHGDVARRVHVSVGGESAGSAPEARLALARFSVHVPARRAPLARECGIDLFDPSASFLLQAPDQQAPAGSGDLPVQGRLLLDVPTRSFNGAPGGSGHIRNLQIFDTDHVEAPRQVCGDFVAPVLTRVSFPYPQLSDRELDPRTPVRSSLSAGQPALKTEQTPTSAGAETEHVKQLASGQRRTYGYATVNADDPTSVGCGDGVGYRGKCDMPAPRAVQRDPVRLDPSGDWPGKPEPHPAHLGYPYLCHASVQASHVISFYCHDAKPFAAPHFAPSRPAVRASEKIPHGFVEVTKRLLLDSLAAFPQPAEFAPRGGELAALFQITRCALTARFPVPMLLHGKIPNMTGVCAMLPHRLLLVSGRHHAVPGHASIFASHYDITGEVKRRCVPRLKAGNFALRSL